MKPPRRPVYVMACTILLLIAAGDAYAHIALPNGKGKLNRSGMAQGQYAPPIGREKANRDMLPWQVAPPVGKRKVNRPVQTKCTQKARRSCLLRKGMCRENAAKQPGPF